jgi:hypothetical protein
MLAKGQMKHNGARQTPRAVRFVVDISVLIMPNSCALPSLSRQKQSTSPVFAYYRQSRSPVLHAPGATTTATVYRPNYEAAEKNM